MRIAVLTKDDYLYQKIYLCTLDTPELKTFRITADTPDVYDVCLFDASLTAPEGVAARNISMGKEEGVDLEIPFTFKELLYVLSPDSTRNMARLSLGDKCAYAFANFIQTMRCVSGQLAEFDEHLWFFTIDIVRVMHDGTMGFVFQNGSEITI